MKHSEKNLGVSRDDSSEKTKKQTNKTNKHFLDPIYLSQIKSKVQKIFRVYFCRCPKMIKIKNKQAN